VGLILEPAAWLDRFAQLAPKVLFCVDGYQYAGKALSNRRPELAQIVAGLDSLEQVVCLPYLNTADPHALFQNRRYSGDDLLAARPVPKSEFKFEQVPFSHPLWDPVFLGPPRALPQGPSVHSQGRHPAGAVEGLQLPDGYETRRAAVLPITTTGLDDCGTSWQGLAAQAGGSSAVRRAACLHPEP